MKPRTRFNQYTGPKEDPAQKAWNREAYDTADRITKKYGKNGRKKPEYQQ